MRKTHLLLFIFLTSIYLASSVSAQLSVTVDPMSSSFDISTTSVHNVTITNNYNTTADVTLTVIGPYVYWTTLNPWFVKVDPSSSRTVSLDFYPTDHVGRFKFTVTVSAPDKENSTQEVELTVVPPQGVIIQNLKTSKLDTQFKIDLVLESLDSVPVTVVSDITDSDGNSVKTTRESTTVNGSKTMTQYLDLEDLKSGRYSVKISLEGTTLTRTDSFEVSGIRNVTKSKKVESNILFDQTTILVTNNGNDVENDYVVAEDIPKGLMLTFLREPTKQTDSDGAVSYEFTIPTLEPGQTAEITYKVEKWPVIVGMFVIVIIIIIAILWLVFKKTTPVITKSVHMGKGIYSVIINVKAPKTKGMLDVTVRDWVNPLAKVQKKFEGVKPNIIESDAGTEIKWKLGDISKGGHRVLHYQIVPVVHAESIKLKHAYVKFRYSPEGSHKKLSSNGVTIHTSG